MLGKAGEAWLLSIAAAVADPALLGVGIGFAQGGIFSFKSMLHFDTLNPFNGFKRLFSMQALVSLVRSLAKVALVGLLTWRGLQQTADATAAYRRQHRSAGHGRVPGQAILDVGIARGGSPAGAGGARLRLSALELQRSAADVAAGS